jgi:hypothetical protein
LSLPADELQWQRQANPGGILQTTSQPALIAHIAAPIGARLELLGVSIKGFCFLILLSYSC